MTRGSSILAQAASALALVAATSACDAILGIPERTLDPNLVCSDGICACAEGFKSCDGDDSNGCEADTANDSRHCGRCGHDCLGGECADAICQPLALVDERDLGDLAVVGGFVYFTSLFNSPIRRVPVRGGEITAVAGTTPGWMLRVDDGTLYWTTPTEVYAASVDGSQPARLVAENVAPSIDMAVGGGMVYWMDFDEATITFSMKRTPALGGTIEVLNPPGPGDEPWSVAADASRGYWGVPNAIMAIAHGGQTPAELTTVVGIPLALEESAGSLYWLDNGVYRLPAGGAPVSLANADFDGAVAIDTDHVYFTKNNGTLNKVPILGGDVEVLATGQEFDFSFGAHVAVDAEAVYWITSEGLYRVVK